MATAPNTQNGLLQERTAPPFLRRVRIEGYKSIASCDVQLHPLTILVGRNASGKTNFVDALAFLRDVLVRGANEAVKCHGGRDAILCRFCPGQRVSLEVNTSMPFGGELLEGIYRLVIDIPVKQPARIAHEYLQLGEGAGWWLGYTNDAGRVTCAASDDSPQERAWGVPDRPFLDAYFDDPVPEFGDRIASWGAYNFYPEAIRRLQKPAAGLLDRDGGNLASVIELTRDSRPVAVDRMGGYLTSITGGVELAGAVRYGEYETVRFRVPTGGDKPGQSFDAASMSDGTLRVLAALVAAFQCVPPYGHPSLVAIEEPETSLHPAAMRALVDALNEATEHTQIVLTTHSADLLAGRDLDASQVLVVRSRNGVTQIAPVDAGSREILRKELYTLADLHRMDQLDLDEDDLARQARPRSHNGEQ